MKPTSATRVAISVMASVGCSGGSSHCDTTGILAEAGYNPTCAAALVFAARDTTELIPTESEIERYFRRWDRVVAAEPILSAEMPQVYLSMGPGFFEMTTTNQAAISAWLVPQDGVPPTGDEAIDSLIASFPDPDLVLVVPDPANGTSVVGVTTGGVFNENVLQARLAPTGSTLPEGVEQPRGNGTWEWTDSTASPRVGGVAPTHAIFEPLTSRPRPGSPSSRSSTDSSGTGSDDATAIIHYRFGFIDCLPGCAGFRNLLAVVPPDSKATVFDLGGDPLPPNLHLSPDTLPPPSD